MKIFKWIVATVLFSVAAYVAVGPFITVYHINKGMVENDAQILKDYIEFPTLRHNMKDQFNLALAKKSADTVNENPFLALGSLFAKTVLDQVVDSLVTPSGLASILEGKTFAAKPSSRRSKTILEPGSDSNSEAVANNFQSKARVEYFNDARYAFQSLSTFSVWVPNNGEETQFILARDGFSWNLVNIIMPISALAENKINNSL